MGLGAAGTGDTMRSLEFRVERNLLTRAFMGRFLSLLTHSSSIGLCSRHRSFSLPSARLCEQRTKELSHLSHPWVPHTSPTSHSSLLGVPKLPLWACKMKSLHVTCGSHIGRDTQASGGAYQIEFPKPLFWRAQFSVQAWSEGRRHSED